MKNGVDVRLCWIDPHEEKIPNCFVKVSMEKFINVQKGHFFGAGLQKKNPSMWTTNPFDIFGILHFHIMASKSELTHTI